MKFKFEDSHPMAAVMASMENEGISDHERQKMEEADVSVVSVAPVKPRLSSKAAHAKRRKASIFRDRRHRKNEVTNRERRRDWITNNFNHAGGHTPFKHKKYTILAMSHLNDE